MRAVIYARYSSKAQTDFSIETQVDLCREFAAQKNWTVVGIYADKARSGRNDKREEFQRMIADAGNKNFDKVIVYDVDRFSRETSQALFYRKFLQDSGVELHFVKSPGSSGKDAFLMFGITSLFAENDVNKDIEKIKDGHDKNIEFAYSNGGTIPFGFKTEVDPAAEHKKRPKKKYVVDEEKRHIVVEIFERYAAGDTIKNICDSLNSRGIKSASGSKFNKNSLRTLLQNKKYIGIYHYKGQEVPDGIPRIISDNLFEAVQLRFEINRKTPHRSEEYLLTNKLFCGHCKSPMTGNIGKSHTGINYYYYSCNKRRYEKTCNKKSIRKDVIEDSIINKIKASLTDDNIKQIAGAVVEKCRDEQKNSDYLKSTVLLKHNKKDQENLINTIQKTGHLASEIAIKALYERLDKLIAEEKELNAQIIIEKKRILDISELEVIFFFEKLRDSKTLSFNQKKMFINTFVKKVYLYDDNRIAVFLYVQKEPVYYTLEDENLIETGAQEFLRLNSLGAPNKKEYRKILFFILCRLADSNPSASSGVI